MKKLLAALLMVSFVSIATIVSLRSVSAEQANNSVSVETIQGPTVSDIIIESSRNSWPWYLTRGSGLVAIAALLLLMLSGIGQITGHTFRFLEPITAWASHRALGIVFGLSIVVHMVSTLFDHFVHFTILDILIPWHSHLKPAVIAGKSFGSLYIALGIIAFYLTIAIVLSSLFWISTKQKLWKFLHILSYILTVLIFFHVLFLGSEFQQGLLRTAWLISGFGLLGASLARFWRAFTA